MTTPTQAITVFKDAIDAGDKALSLYDKALDHVIPWKTFEDTVKNLSKYQKDYSTPAGALVGEVKTLLLTANDKYLAATQSVFEWCGLSSPLLSAYLALFENYNADKAESQKTLVLKVLSEGIVKMTAAQASLQQSSESFNGASGKIIALNVQLKNDFDSGSRYFQAQVEKLRKEAYGGAAAGAIAGPIGLLISYAIAAGVLEGQLIPQLKEGFAKVKSVYEQMSTLVDKAGKDIASTKVELQKEIERIGEIKTEAEVTHVFVKFDDNLIEDLRKSARSLIERCNAYRANHSGSAIVPAAA